MLSRVRPRSQSKLQSPLRTDGLKWLLSIASLALVGCVSPAAEDPVQEFGYDSRETAAMRQMMLGVWCGEKKFEDGGYQKWLVERFPDGTYRIDFTKTSPGGRADTWGEFGIWGIRKPIYFTAMRGVIQNDRAAQVDPTNPDLYDAYKVLSLTEQEFTYRSYTSGNTFTIKRQCDEHI